MPDQTIPCDGLLKTQYIISDDNDNSLIIESIETWHTILADAKYEYQMICGQ